MTSRSATRLLILQTGLMVALAWAAVWLGRDEYRLAVGREDDEVPVRSQLAEGEDAGLPEVRLSALAQQRAGIEVAMPVEAALGAQAPWWLNVVDPRGLLDWRERLLTARQAVELARAAARASEAERRRVQALYDDDRNASLRQLEQATAQAAADATQDRAAQARLDAARAGLRSAWGDGVAAWFEPPGPSARRPGRERQTDERQAIERPHDDHLTAVLSGREVLLRAVQRADDSTAAPARLQWPRAGDPAAAPVTARLLGALPAAAGAAPEGTAGGRQWLYLAPGAGLAVGVRLQARASDARGAEREGLLVPASAVIWHAGQPWVYVRESGRDEDDEDQAKPKARSESQSQPQATPTPTPTPTASPPKARFQRRAVPTAQRVGDHWFIPGLAEDDPVVVRGAQVLLSEELKFQIKNENDD